MTALVNGRVGEFIHIADRGLAYGDGLFETMRVHDGRIRLLRYHLERLEQGCRRLSIPPPPQDTLIKEIDTVGKDRPDGVVKLIVTRGRGKRGQRPPDDAEPTRILMTSPLPESPAALDRTGGVRVAIADIRLASQPRLAGLKHLNRLELVLASAESGDYEERVMLNARGDVIDGTMMNIFVIHGNELATPDLSTAGVAGVMRRHVMQLAEMLGIRCEARRFHRDELRRADEIFLCNAVRGVWPVTVLDDKQYPVGAVTRRLTDALAEGWP